MRRRQSLCVLEWCRRRVMAYGGGSAAAAQDHRLPPRQEGARVDSDGRGSRAAPDQSRSQTLSLRRINGETLWMRTIAWIRRWRDGCGMRDSGARLLQPANELRPHIPSPRPTQRKRFIIGLRSQYMARCRRQDSTYNQVMQKLMGIDASMRRSDLCTNDPYVTARLRTADFVNLRVESEIALKLGLICPHWVHLGRATLLCQLSRVRCLHSN